MKRAGLLAALSCALLAGCLTTPPVEESWTKLEILDVQSSAPSPEDTMGAFNVRAKITYRAIVTGSIVADVRYSADPLLIAELAASPLDATEPQLESAQRIDALLQSTTSLGFAHELVTGFDHLIQEIDLSIEGDPFTPDSTDSTVTVDSTGAFLLVLYMADVDEMEDEEGEEVLEVTPYLTTDREILSAALVVERAE